MKITNKITRPSFVVLAFLTASLLASSPVESQTPLNQASKLTEDLNMLNSASWQYRATSFYQIVALGLESEAASRFPIADGILNIMRLYPASKDSLVNGLNTLLEVEQATIFSGVLDTGSDDAYSNYYGDILNAVSTLRDIRSAHALLGAINTGNMALEALAGFGEEAATPALGLLNGTDDETRLSAIALLAKVCDPKNIGHLKTPESRKKIKDALVQASTMDRLVGVRLRAIDGLGRLGDNDIVVVLSQLTTKAGNDSGSAKIAEAANAALNRISSKH